MLDSVGRCFVEEHCFALRLSSSGAENSLGMRLKCAPNAALERLLVQSCEGPLLPGEGMRDPQHKPRQSWSSSAFEWDETGCSNLPPPHGKWPMLLPLSSVAE